jgi:exo-1,4-beta-D-glucosaminidase
MKLCAALLAFGSLAAAVPRQAQLLREGWAIQSSADVRETGAAISSADYRSNGWYSATLPSTVLSALVQDHVYPEPYSGMNLRQISGTAYPISSNFSNALMPPDSPFRHSWWYRTTFQVPTAYKGRTVWLGFDGINFRANVWMNGKQIAYADQTAGAWRLFEFDVTAIAKAGETNALAVEIFPPLPSDLAITFVDWNPLPPDKDMGLWRDVYLSASGPVAVRFPAVFTKLNLPANDQAQLTVRCEVKNAAAHAVDGVLRGKIADIEFSQTVRLSPHESRVIHFAPEQFPQLKVAKPRLWWPAQLGAQNLYPLDLTFEIGGKPSDQSSIEFGIRQVTSEVDAQGHRLFHINGKNILVRGAGYTFDMMLRSSPERQEAELKYVRDMNLNAVRFEGKLEDDHFLDLCDRYGILVLAGWCCCDHWEKWQDWSAEDETIAAESLRDQLRRMERHPALFDWMYGSDNPPPPKIEQIYLDVIKETEWPNPYHSSATAKPTKLGGPTGVKMTGPYEYVAPEYWLLDSKYGGAHGFNSETSPGPSPPPVESMKSMLPREHQWPIDSWWDYHAGGGVFKDIHVFTEALNARYGASQNLEQFARKSQMMAYEGERAMFEAYGRNKYVSTGVIQWMLNNAWPGLIWHLYDWYLRPGGGYFGAKKANEPLHVQYSYDDRSIVVVNSYYKAFTQVKAHAAVYNLDMTQKYVHDITVDIPEDSATRVFKLPDIPDLTSTYFVSLSLSTATDASPFSRNLYWLSTRPETLDWDKSTWYYTPTKTFADFTALSSLPPVTLKVDSDTVPQGIDRVTMVSIENPSSSIAFGIRLRVTKGADGDEVLPVVWEDNYFALLPGEKRAVTATYRAKDLGRAAPFVQAEAWNHQ